VAVLSTQYVTLVANTVATVTFAVDLALVEVASVDGAAVVYVTTDGTTPAANTTGSDFVAASAGAFTLVKVDSSADNAPRQTTVKLISTGTPTVSVRPA
jgi:hypothetical protein